MSLIPALLGIGVAATHLEAARTVEPVVIDGQLDEKAWSAAKPTDAFTQKSPHGGAAPSERTTVRILYDAEAIYVGFDCQQVDSPVVARLTRRDREVESDAVSISLDTRGDGTTAFMFSVNAAGVLRDGAWFDDTKFSADWDENWEGAAHRTAHGWSAELRIPLRVLRFDEGEDQRWGLQLRRYVSNRQESDEWVYIPRDTAGEVSHYGRLDGLRGLRHHGGVEFRPFVVGSISHLQDDPDTIGRGFRLGGGAGLDVKWRITPRLTLDGTLNPDFGQVEADQVVLNLTSYEQFLPEKRQFFLEGADTFATPQQLVYTRRIGAAPPPPEIRGGPPFGEQLVDLPEPASIYGAAKVVGNLGGRVTTGELLAVTSPSEVTVRLADGSYERRVADPLATFRVLRVKREIGKNAHVGALVTAVDRVEQTGSYPVLPAEPGGRAVQLCPGGETASIGGRCFHDAYAAGVDGRWRSPSGDWVAEGQAIGTLIHDGPPRTQPDGTVIASGDVAPGGQVSIKKEGGNWVGGVEYEGHGRTLDYNDVGFMPRQNLHRAGASFGYRWLQPRWITLEGESWVEAFEQDTLDFLNLARGARLYGATKFENFWELFAGLRYGAAHFDDREVGDGAALERAQVVAGEVFIGTDPRKPLLGGLYGQLEVLPEGYNLYGEGRLAVRVLPEVDLELLPVAFINTGEPRFFESDDPASYRFGRLRAESFGVTIRATYTFTPRLTLQAYGQMFLASEHFSDFTAFAKPAGGALPVIHLADLRPAVRPVDNPDFEEAVFNANVVLRWEYTLGSTFYLVYTHGQTKDRTPRFGEPARLNLGLLAPHLAGDAVLLKLAYWLG